MLDAVESVHSDRDRFILPIYRYKAGVLHREGAAD